MEEYKKRPEIRGKVIAVMPEWRNNTGTFWKREVVIETGLRFENPIKVTFAKEKTEHLEGIGEGDCVIIPYVLNGRRWDGPNGTQYFNDIVGMGLQKITGSVSAPKSEPILGCTMETAIEKWSAHFGDDKAAFAAFCQEVRPDIVKEASAAGQKFSAYARNKLDVWGDIATKIEAKAQAEKVEVSSDDDVDDLPF